MTENIPKEEVAIPLGRVSEEILKSTALLGVSGFLFEIALTIAPAKFGAVPAIVVCIAGVLLFSIGAWQMVIGIVRFEKLTFPNLKGWKKTAFAWVVSILMVLSMFTIAIAIAMAARAG